MKRALGRAALLLMVGLAACSGNGAAEQTLESRNALLGTQLAQLQASATVETDRLGVTAQAAEDEINRVLDERSRMIATLQARGIDTRFIPGAATPLPTLQSAPVTPQAVTPQAPQTTLPVMATLTLVPITAFTPTPGAPAETPVPAQGSQPTLGPIITAENVGADDCAVAAVTQFTAQTERIYAVSVASNFADGTTVTARFTQGSDIKANFSFTYNRIERACIWFYVDQTDFAFLPGIYTVTMTIDGTTTAPVQAQFSIVGSGVGG